MASAAVSRVSPPAAVAAIDFHTPDGKRCAQRNAPQKNAPQLLPCTTAFCFSASGPALRLARHPASDAVILNPKPQRPKPEVLCLSAFVRAPPRIQRRASQADARLHGRLGAFLGAFLRSVSLRRPPHDFTAVSELSSSMAMALPSSSAKPAAGLSVLSAADIA